MIVRRQNEVPAEALNIPGAAGSQIQWLTDGEQTENFYMRRVVIAPGGVVVPHEHPWEHEMYILSGRGEAVGPDGPVTVEPGAYIQIPGGQGHSIKNAGPDDLVFICCVGPNPDGRYK